jgi:hypothetical protein
MGGAVGTALILTLGLVQYRFAQAAGVERAELRQRGDHRPPSVTISHSYAMSKPASADS